MRLNKVCALLFLLGAVPIRAAGESSDAPPKKKLTLQDLLNKAAGSPQQTTAVAGVRGLEETNGDVDTKARDYAAIDRLNALVIHDDELKAFIDDGKLK